jgi:hypothetical protein
MKSRLKIFTIIFSILFVLFFTSCSLNPFSPQEYQQNNPNAEVLFKVAVPNGKIGNNDLFIEILDEVTGLGLNPTRYQMQPVDAQFYSVRLPLTIGFSVKYRYVKGGNPPSLEYDSENKQVRYRMLIVKGPIEVDDLIAGWQDSSFQGKMGTLQGYIFNETNSEPVSNAMVIIAGMRTFTGADGSYVINNIPAGEHNLTAYHIDGLFLPFQQRAIIAANAVTPANFGMKPAQLVNITFKVTPPAENLSGVSVRLFGDLNSLGNTFNDLQGGISSPGSRGRLMNYQDDGTYSITLSLPAGHPLEYKYSLGDGFWNAEHSSDFSWKTRKIIIPSSDLVINDAISTWKNSNENALTFKIIVPANTPQDNLVLLQLNPFVWMEPLPIWNLGNNQWMYVLYSPIEFIRNSNYRIQLIGQFGIQNDIATSESNSTGMKIDTTNPEMNYAVQQWSSNK